MWTKSGQSEARLTPVAIWSTTSNCVCHIYPTFQSSFMCQRLGNFEQLSLKLPNGQLCQTVVVIYIPLFSVVLCGQTVGHFEQLSLAAKLSTMSKSGQL